MNLQCNEPSSALFSLPDISIPGYAGEKCLDNHDSSWEESLMTDSNIQPISHCRRPDILHINPAFPKSMLMMGSSLSLEGSTISEMPPSFPHQFGGQSRPFPLALGTSPLDYNRVTEGIPNAPTLSEMVHNTNGDDDDEARRRLVKRQRTTIKHPAPPSSSYVFYMNECRTRMLRTRPDLAFADVARLIGSDWAKISPSDRQKYHDMAQEDKLRHQREMDAQMVDDASQQAIKRRKRDPKAPKHPISAYLFFVAESRARLCKDCPEMGFGDMAKYIGIQWKDMSSADRTRYEIMADRDKTRYEKDLQTYSKPEEIEGAVPDASVKVQAETLKSRRKRAPNAPKHPISAYLFFVAEQRRALSATCPGKTFKELATDIGFRWKGLSDAEREPYILSASADKERYEREKEEFAGHTAPSL